MIGRHRWPKFGWSAALVIMLQGCAGFNPVPPAQLDFLERTETLEKEDIRVTAGVLTRQETRDAFSKALDKEDVQPVWIKVENNSDQPLWLMLTELDPNYFPASEAAAIVDSATLGKHDRIARYFDAQAINPVIPAGESSEGFAFINLRQGTRNLKVKLIGRKQALELEFFIEVPGLRADWQMVDFESLYTANEFVDIEDPKEFRDLLEDFLCCTTRKDGTGTGDPVNLVVISSGADALLAFLRAGWDETEIITFSSSMRTAKSFLTSGEYKNSPISALYLFGRPQDISLQKARDTINERNHLRLWLAPWRFRGNNVWIGGISRDIGVAWTTRTWSLTTHAIDSEVDEARNYIIEDLALSQGLISFGFVTGVGASTPDDDRENLLGTPWWTDGLRAVVEPAMEPALMEDMAVIPWARRMRDFRE